LKDFERLVSDIEIEPACDRIGSSTNGEKPATAGIFAADSRHRRLNGCFVVLT